MTLLHEKTTTMNNVAIKCLNVTANLEVIDQNLSAVVYLSSSSTVLSLLPMTRMCIITTGHDLASVALPVGVDMFILVHAVEGHQPFTFLRSPEAFLTHCSLCTSLWWALLTSPLRFVLFVKSLNHSWLNQVELGAFSMISLQITVNKNWNVWNAVERIRANREPKYPRTFWSDHHVGCERRNAKLLEVDHIYELGVKVHIRAKILVYAITEQQAH